MHYRYAYLPLLLLLGPLIGVAFWPGYFSDLGHAGFALHAHGLTASAWMLLLAFQSWTIHARRRAWHRAAGLALFALLPLFTAGGLLAMRSMAVKAAAGHPFYAQLGPRLGLDDLVAIVAVPWMVRAALVERRRVALHAGYMLATALLVLPPVLARVLPDVPGFPGDLLPGRIPFDVAYHAAQLVAIAIAAGLALLDRRNAAPFLTVIGVSVLRSVLVETIGWSAMWRATFAALPAMPGVLLALAGAAAVLALLWTGWTQGSRGRAARPAPYTAG